MAFKALTTAGAMVALLAASSSYAVTPAQPVIAKDAAKVMAMGRARTLMINGNRASKGKGKGTNVVVLAALAAGLTGLGIAAAAGAFHSSN
jgi:hypothetical protein